MPKKSFIKWAVDQGLTVFVVSWKSADASMKDVVWDDYIRAQLGAIDHVRDRLDAPENVLARGYSITTDAATGQVIRRAAQVKAGQKLRTRVSEGEFESVIPPGRNAGQ